MLIVLKGKILDVGTEDQVKIPQNARVQDMTGKVIIPGLVDTHSHIGIFGRAPAAPTRRQRNDRPRTARRCAPSTPSTRTIPASAWRLAGGVTTANIMPGSGNAIGGQTLYVKLAGTASKRCAS